MPNSTTILMSSNTFPFTFYFLLVLLHKESYQNILRFGFIWNVHWIDIEIASMRKTMAYIIGSVCGTQTMYGLLSFKSKFSNHS